MRLNASSARVTAVWDALALVFEPQPTTMQALFGGALSLVAARRASPALLSRAGAAASVNVLLSNQHNVSSLGLRRGLSSSASSSSSSSSSSSADKDSAAAKKKAPAGALQGFLDFFSFRPESEFVEFTPPVGQYRHPSPGADHGKVSIPDVPDEDLKFNIQYYTRDTRRNQPPMKVMSANYDALPLPKESDIQQLGSPGRPNPNVALYDPTGTRSTMTTTHKQMRALVEKRRPDHLPAPWWAKDPKLVASIVNEAEGKGRPQYIGVALKWRMSHPLDGKW